MIPFPYRTFIFYSRFDIPKLVKRIDQFRGKAGFSHFQGTVNESGFKLYDYGGLSKRSFIYYFIGEFRDTEDGTDVTVRLQPRALEAVILIAIWGISAGVVLNPDLRGIGITAGAGMTAMYFGISWIEWWSLKSILIKACGNRRGGRKSK